MKRDGCCPDHAAHPWRRPVVRAGNAPGTGRCSVGHGADTPEACIERMFAAAQRGDVTAYLDCFTGSERDRLDRELAGQPPEVFARSLRDAVATLKGRAVFRNDAPTRPPIPPATRSTACTKAARNANCIS